MPCAFDGTDVAQKYGVKSEASVQRLQALLDRFKRLAQQLARTRTYADDTRKLVASARERFEETRGGGVRGFSAVIDRHVSARV